MPNFESDEEMEMEETEEEIAEKIEYFWPEPSERCKEGTCNCSMH